MVRRLARVHLHHGWAPHAMRLLQRAATAAQQCGSGRAVGLVQANLAWAHAITGDARAVPGALQRATDEYARGEHDDVPAWLRFFNAAELHALHGVALAHLPNPTPQQRDEAIRRLTLSTALRQPDEARSRSFGLATMAWMLLDNGDTDHAITVAHQSLDLAEHIKSDRVADRLDPLLARLGRYSPVGAGGGGGLHDLAARIQRVQRLTRRCQVDLS